MDYKFRLSCIFLLSAPSLLFAQDTLIFALDIIRHGDRTPIIPLSSVDYQWKDGPGQLTPEGMQQEYKLGTQFRKKYIEQEHLLSDHYQPGTIYVRSTYVDRTLMSAQSLLMGLYPPGTGPKIADSSLPALPNAFQPIPIFSAPEKLDDVIFQQVSREDRAQLMKQYVHSTAEWQAKNNELQDKYPMWSTLFGIPINNLADIQLIGDSLHIHQLHHAPMPVGLSSQDIETIISASGWAFMAQERPHEVATVYSSKLMTHIANYLNNGSHKASKLKYVLLSAHDNTIASALSFLKAPLKIPPPYASNLNFSLYERGTNYYLVKVTYNGTPVTIPACGGSTCELQQFVDIVHNSSSFDFK